MKYLAKVWTSALTFGALMVAGSTAASAHQINGNQNLNHQQNNQQTSTKMVNQNQSQNQNKQVYPLYYFKNDQNQFRLGSITRPRRYHKHYAMRKQLTNFKISHHHYVAKRNSGHSKANKRVTKLMKPVKKAVNVKKANHQTAKSVKVNNSNVVPAENNENHNETSNTNFDNTQLAKLARTKLGDPYVWGATGANAFDCSGFTQYLYKNAKHINIPRTAQAQYDYEKHVSYNNIKPGNLVFFGYSPNAIAHVGMYIGNGKMIDAQNRGVIIENVLAPWWNLVGCAKIFD